MRNPILTLRHLVQESAHASTAEKRAQGIVTSVKSAMNVAACSLYLSNEEGILTLVATEGLNPGSIGNIQLSIGEGLVGAIAKTQHPLNIECASEHPDFQFFPDSGEERYKGFLGAPIVHTGQLAGVLVVEQQERRKFSEEEESFLVTVAAHLGDLEPSDFLPEELLVDSPADSATRRLTGIGASPGVGVGHVVHISDAHDFMDIADAETNDVEGEIKRFAEAANQTLADLKSARHRLASNTSREILEVFSVYEMLLEGNDLRQAVEERIRAGSTASSALRSTIAEFTARFDAMDDDYFRARQDDLHVLAGRLHSHLNTTRNQKPHEDGKTVLAGRLVSIADIAEYPVEDLAGIACGEGSALSHTALLAKALGIPAVMGLAHQGDLQEGELAVVDGYQGTVLGSPSTTVVEEYTRLIEREKLLSEDLSELKEEPALTPDGVRVALLANTGLLADISPGLEHGAEGVGLYRSEIPFMVRDAFPSEDEQVHVYQSVLDAYRGLPVYARTLDIGGDKPLPYFPYEEENPALGWRGLRFTLDNSAVLMTQVRAMLRASMGHENLRIMLPMVSAVSEVESFSRLLDSACQQLGEEGIVVKRPPIGLMAEVPAMTTLLPFLAPMVDFISVGSNDLSQYLLAVDRNNARVADRFDHLHPGVLHAIEEIAGSCRQLGLEVSVCGDLASDPCGVVLLLAMGIRALSMPAPSIPRIKWLLRTITLDQARTGLELARKASNGIAIRSGVQEILLEAGLGKLLEPDLKGNS